MVCEGSGVTSGRIHVGRVMLGTLGVLVFLAYRAPSQSNTMESSGSAEYDITHTLEVHSGPATRSDHRSGPYTVTAVKAEEAAASPSVRVGAKVHRTAWRHTPHVLARCSRDEPCCIPLQFCLCTRVVCVCVCICACGAVLRYCILAPPHRVVVMWH
jgi:hypothetical protein